MYPFFSEFLKYHNKIINGYKTTDWTIKFYLTQEKNIQYPTCKI